jgi:hypothetical protein
VIRDFHGRTLVCCDNCPVRLDLGDARAVRARNRTPSGWIRVGADRHYCPSCSPHLTMTAFFQHPAGARPQPLL